MTSQWAAVGAEADPLRRARQLQRSWERLLGDGALGPELPHGATVGLRPTIVESWRRSLATGLEPTDLLAPIEADESEVLERWFDHPLGSLTHVLTEQLRKLAEESRGMVVVTDASGLVLHRVGDEWLKERAAEMNLVEGARYDEASDGTNGIGTALAADHAFQVFAFEHFNDRHHQWVCSGAPVHDPVSGQTVGLIDLSTLWKNAHPRSLELVTAAAGTIEQHLVDARHDRDSRLRRRYSDFMTRSTDLLVDRDGYLLDGAELGHPSPFDIPEIGGEVVLADGSLAVAAPLGRGEAFLLRQHTTRHPKSAAKGLERAEERARELATEQAALRQVATLVARESSPDQLFAVVAEQVARVFEVPHVRLVRYEPDGSVVIGGFSADDDEPFPIGSRWPLDSPGVTATVRQTGRPARVEDYADLAGEIAAVVRGAGMRSTVASPIVVGRRLWGAMVVLSPRHEPFPEDTESRLTDFSELVATAIANAESREALARLAEEQAALRRVATLVASGGGPEQLFRAVAAEVQELLAASMSGIVRFEDDETATTLANQGGGDHPAAGTRHPLDPDFVMATVRRTGRAARFDTDDPTAASMPAIVRETGSRSTVASPIVVEGELWGAIAVGSIVRSLPADTERRLADFTELVATAVANTQAREQLRALAEEQAALRQVAVLVAQQPSPSEVFMAVTQAVGLLLDADLAVLHVFGGDGAATTVASWGSDGSMLPIGTRFPLDGDSLAARIFESGAPARMYSHDEAWQRAATVLAQSLRVRSAVGAPILVQGKLWGALMAATRGVGQWAENAEARIAAFTELVATAIANAESREALAELAEEQAALRRVATLVAQGVQPAEIFAAVSMEVEGLFGSGAGVLRFEDDGPAVVFVGVSSIDIPIGTRWEFQDGMASAEVYRTGHSARVDAMDWSSTSGPIAATARGLGVVSTVASPIVVEGRLWGAITVSSAHEAVPPDTEGRLEKFTELVATAIANAESREARAVLTEDQAALRRVATLVAQGASPRDLFAAVAEEVGRLLLAANVSMGRYEPDESVTSMASWSSVGPVFPAGVRWQIKGTNVAWLVLQTGRPARIDDFSAATDPIGVAVREAGYKSAIGSPIVVEGHLWGVISAASSEGPMPPGTEARLTSFTELVATAIANAESQSALERLADEQAALRRVATLVAQDAPPAVIFSAVSEEVEGLFESGAAVLRFEQVPPTIVFVGISSVFDIPIGTRWELQEGMATAEVYRTGRPARVDAMDIAPAGRELGVVSSVATPIVVEGRLWGAVSLASTDEQLPPDAEERLVNFTELVATAIANAEGKSELAASRRRIVAASDETRRRIERNLHDGTQQRLVSLGLAVRAAEADLPLERDDLRAQLSGVAAGLVAAVEDLQEISRGIHPAILSKGGLGPALRTLAHRSAIPVDLDITTDVRLAEPIEVAAYFVASEALANAAKHSEAARIDVSLERRDGNLLLSVRDDGVGGADAARGSGIVGLNDRVEALGGSLHVESSPGEGTRIVAQLPLDLELERPV